MTVFDLVERFILFVIPGFIVYSMFCYLTGKKPLFRFANFLNLSHRADNSSVWDYMFDRQPWIVVRDYVTGNTYYGKVIKYSDGTETRELLLEEVSVWSKADGEYKMEEVYLSRLPSEFSIEIDNYIKYIKVDNGKWAEAK